MQPALDQMLSSLGPHEYSALDLENLRALRSKATVNEEAISYLRRVIQVRLDIIASELNNRRSGASPSDVSDIINRLPHILFETHVAGGSNRPPSSLEVPEIPDDLTLMVDEVLPTSRLVALGELQEDEIVALCAAAEELEREISDARRKLHDIIDGLGHELARRFRSGESPVGSIEN